ncbi:hypothetical protein B484DRAFT_449387 [Ochromonadaceae sp. CCMP2298]|nr:hypothetical protein B484DRAFT_449387 [Ochromonadaceae sp. CCMP2298]|mmetsp:Transcript_27588/g.61825  ORF Transcript_27588/g.61825 Transcript_27588/m.61825 type:complete len:536 (-) Transcript_27588:86-1693(-)
MDRLGRDRKQQGRQQPKRLLTLRKSHRLQRWLLQNPWVRPMCVFNYAAIKIQKHFRGHRRRRGPLVRAPKPKRKGGSKQLDHYLSYLDKCRVTGRKPRWLDEGYSSWCAVRIQSMWKMHRVRKRSRMGRQLVNQVASIILQTAWRNRMYRQVPDITKPVLGVFMAAEMVQLCWRAYCNRRIYRYFRDLVKTKLKGAPFDLLRAIIPTEAHVLDRASGTHVRFRLGGSVFPPKVYFKIYTHRPLCDVNSFAPRDYSSERPADPLQVENRSSTLDATKRKVTAIKVGVRYFGAVVKSTSAEGTANWYRRDENNNWRPIVSAVFDSIITPPWFREATYVSRAKPFHFSKLRRDEDIKKARKKRRRQWMVKAYMQATAAADTAASLVGMDSDSGSGSRSARSRSTSPHERVMMARIAEEKSSFREGSSGVGLHSDSSPDPKRGPPSPSRASMFKQSFSDSFASSAVMKMPVGGKDAGGRRSGAMPVRRHASASAQPKSTRDELVDLVDWSMALNFDDYTRDWDKIGTSLPSDAYGTAYK